MARRPPPVDRSPTFIRTGYRATQGFVRGFFKLAFGLKVHGIRNVPREGGFILASNHQSFFDPPLVGSTCPREIFYAAKRELFHAPIIGRLVRYYNSIPVKRSGYDRALLETLEQVLKQGFGIVIFPEGTRYLDGELHRPKAGVGRVAWASQAPIIPVYIHGSNRMRRRLLRRDLSITFGRPFTAAEVGAGQVPEKGRFTFIAQETMKRITAIKGSPAAEGDKTGE